MIQAPPSGQTGMELDAFIGEWTIEASFEGAPAGTVVFEWMSGGEFLVQRWEVPHPAAPDGLAVIGYDEGRGTYLQHYFDSRGVARVYEMSLEGNTWTLSRTEPDFTPLDFAQRWVGTFSDDGRTIDGTWETSPDGSSWEKDFDLTYRKR
jgi:hypothetical protein